MNITSLDDDLCTGYSLKGGLGYPAPDGFTPDQLDALRFDGKAVIDVRETHDWLVDDFGIKRLPSMHNDRDWQTIECDWNAKLVKTSDGWAVETADQAAQVRIAAAHQIVAELHADALVYLSGNATPADRDTWIMKRDAARSFLAGETVDEDGDNIADFLTGLFAPGEADAITASGGEPARVMAEKIIGKARGFKTLVGMAEASKREGEAAVEATGGNAEALAATMDAIRTAAAERKAQFIAASQGGA